jgi:hypothetical protein
VLVSFNYRFGALGFLTHPAITGANFGLLDQLAAPQWPAFSVGSDIWMRFGEPVTPQPVSARPILNFLRKPAGKNSAHWIHSNSQAWWQMR